MRVETFHSNLQETLMNAYNASKGQTKTKIHNALCKINKYLANVSGKTVADIKKFVKAQVINLEIYRDFKRKIFKLLDKIK